MILKSGRKCSCFLLFECIMDCLVMIRGFLHQLRTAVNIISIDNKNIFLKAHTIRNLASNIEMRV